MRNSQAARGELFDKNKLEFVSALIVMESETREEEMPTEEEMLLREDENISIEDQGGIISLLTAMNDNMKAMGESLKNDFMYLLQALQTLQRSLEGLPSSGPQTRQLTLWPLPIQLLTQERIRTVKHC